MSLRTECGLLNEVNSLVGIQGSSETGSTVLQKLPIQGYHLRFFHGTIRLGNLSSFFSSLPPWLQIILPFQPQEGLPPYSARWNSSLIFCRSSFPFTHPFLSHRDHALLSCIDHYNIYSHFILRFSNIPLRAGIRFLNHVGRLAWMCLCVIRGRRSIALFWFLCSLTWVFNWTQYPGDPYIHSCLRRTSLEAGEAPRVLVPVNT